MGDLSDTSEVLVERGAIRRMSWRILPLIGLGYLFALMDRINVSFAALQMNHDLAFSATVYGLGSGMFYLAYALFEVPSNLILAKVGARRWLARIMVTWGIIAAGMMFVTTPLQFYVMRFLLGMAEAGFFPGIVFYLSHWFPRAQRGRAISRFYFFGPLSSALMGVLSAWLLSLDGIGGLQGWQWLFLVQGLPSAMIGIAFLLWLPDDPRSVKWLKPDEQQWVERRLAADAVHMGKPAHNLLAAITNPLVIRFGLLGLMTIGVTVTFTLSAPLMLKENAGLSVKSIGLLTSLGGVLGAGGMLATGWLSDRHGERFTTMIVSTFLLTLSFAISAIATQPAVLIGAYLLFAATWGPVTLSQVSAWPDYLHQKVLGVSCAAINTLSQAGAFLMPLAWGRARDMTGSFHFGLVMLTAVGIAALGLALSLRARLSPGKIGRLSGAYG